MSTPFPHSPSTPRPSVICRICGKLVSIETAKTNADGQAIHEQCYAVKTRLEQASRDGHEQRPWNVIAEEVTHEQNPKKMTELVEELNDALAQQKLDGTPKVPDGNRKPERE